VSTLRFHDDLSSVARDDWNDLVGDGSPFLEWDFLRALEEAGCVEGASGWIPRHLTVHDGERLVGAAPLYVKLDGQGEFVFDHAWAELSRRLGRRYYPKLVAAVPFTPVAGSRLLVSAGEDRCRSLSRMLRAIDGLATQAGLSGLHVLFPDGAHADELERLGLMVRPGVRHRWRNEGYRSFEDFLARFRSRRRASIRRERAKLASEGIRLEVLEADRISGDLVPTMHRFYRATVDKHLWGLRHLNRRFFELLAERWRKNLHVVVARQGERVVGLSINAKKSGALYGRYWGGEDIPFLHFEVCYYRPIEWCIEHGYSVFDPGAGADHKAPRGFVAEAQPSAHRLYDAELADLIGRHLSRERDQWGLRIEEMRRGSPLKGPVP
jgi:predicted N-acyltransferase